MIMFIMFTGSLCFVRRTWLRFLVSSWKRSYDPSKNWGKSNSSILTKESMSSVNPTNRCWKWIKCLRTWDNSKLLISLKIYFCFQDHFKHDHSISTLLMRLYFACCSAQEFPGGDQHFWKWPQNHGTWSHNFVGSQSQVLSPPVHLFMLKPCFSRFVRSLAFLSMHSSNDIFSEPILLRILFRKSSP